MITNTEIITRVDAYIDALLANYAKRGYAIGTGNMNFSLENKGASKYHRIVMNSHGQRSVHAFVDAEGFVYKSAGWKAPIKGRAAYDLLNDESFANLLKEAQWSGGHLYVGGGTHIKYTPSPLSRPVVTVVDELVEEFGEIIEVLSETVKSSRRPAPKSRKPVLVTAHA